MSRDKLVQKVTYKAGAQMIRQSKLPTLYHNQDVYRVESCEITEGGIIDRNGERLQYQVLKVILRERATLPVPPPAGAPPPAVPLPELIAAADAQREGRTLPPIWLTNEVGGKLPPERLDAIHLVLEHFDWTLQSCQLEAALERLQVRGSIGPLACNLYDYLCQGWVVATRPGNGA